MRTTGIIIAITSAILLLSAIVKPQFSGPGLSGVFNQAMNEAKQVGLAAKLFADDHQGRLPETLQQLTPDYLPDETFFQRMQLTTPGVLLKDLPPTAIIVIKTATDMKRKQTRVVFVRADLSVYLQRP